MRKILKHCMILPLLGCVVALFAACNEWTDPESAGVKGPSFPNDDPAAYARYTEALRTYKAQEHTIAFGWFDNSAKVPVSRAQHPASVPDSMDVLSLLHPDNLADWEVKEFAELREKGTKVIFTFSYADILAAYQATLPPAPEPTAEAGAGDDAPSIDEPVEDGFLAYLTQQTDAYLNLVDKYGYDGVSVFYEPQLLAYLQPADKAREEARQQLFVEKLRAFRQTHPDNLFVFEGLPQNLADKSLLDACDYIVMRAFSAVSYAQLSLVVNAAAAEGVPTDRFVIGVQTLPLDTADLTTGRFADALGAMTLTALTEAAKWTASPGTGIVKAGLGVYDLQNDYYNTTVIYMNTREAIATLNPSPKN